MPHPVRVYPARRAFAVGHPGDLPARRGRISWLGTVAVAFLGWALLRLLFLVGHCCGCSDVVPRGKVDQSFDVN
jgi:hypothetical protein